MNYYILLISPLGFIIGGMMRKSSGSSSNAKGGFFERISGFFTSYIIYLVIAALCFGAGYAIMHVLDKRPPEGIGRYQ